MRGFPYCGIEGRRSLTGQCRDGASSVHTYSGRAFLCAAKPMAPVARVRSLHNLNERRALAAISRHGGAPRPGGGCRTLSPGEGFLTEAFQAAAPGPVTQRPESRHELLRIGPCID